MIRKEQVQERPKRPYTKPRLVGHGSIEKLTKSEYGGLDKALFGSLFAIASPPAFPGAPTR